MKLTNKNISTYNANTFVESKEWIERKDLYDFPNFMVSTPSWLDDGFDEYCKIEEKIAFYQTVKEITDIIKDIAKNMQTEIVCVGPYLRGENYCEWRGLNKFDSYNSLKKIIKSKEYKILDLNNDINIISLIIENNFRYFSEICFFLKNPNMLIYPTHHMELIVFSDKIELAKSKFLSSTENTSWKIIEG